jgi:LmbE family N-acetylglucosaminyl deacetylase
VSNFYARVYLSPHLDDAVLSCGGLIHRQARAGEPPLVITLFSGQPPANVELSAFARSQHERWGARGDVMAVRWAEDRAALAVLGADYLRLNYPDCIYRGRARGEEAVWYYASEEALFGPVHPSENGLSAELAAVLREFISPGGGVTLYAPLTVGNHVDHQLTFAAALILGAQGWDLRFYEDYPYAEREGALSAALAARGAEHWQPGVAPLDEDDLAAKIEAIARYESQLGVLFGSAEAMPDRARDFVTRTGGERFWQPSYLHTSSAED